MLLEHIQNRIFSVYRVDNGSESSDSLIHGKPGSFFWAPPAAAEAVGWGAHDMTYSYLHGCCFFSLTMTQTCCTPL
jgi:hypothetical protein